MQIDAMVLAGGRSSRLGGVPKAALEYHRRSLLEHAIDAVTFARCTVVVGDLGDMLPAGVLTTREEPAFGGPAAGIAAGLARLELARRERARRERAEEPSDFTFVLACDMPRINAAVTALHRALTVETDFDGLLAIDDNEHPQPLAAVYRTPGIAEVAAELRRLGRLDGSSVFALIAPLKIIPIAVPAGSTDDVDTWEDASRFGITHPEKTEES